MFSRQIALVFVLSLCVQGQQQPWKGNTDESQVKAYELPDVLTLTTGGRVKTTEEWEKKRRPEIVKLFEEHVFGRTPSGTVTFNPTIIETDAKALGGRAVRKQVALKMEKDGRSVTVNLLLYLPNSGKPAPVFVGLNFMGNHTVHSDPAIRRAELWVRETPRDQDTRSNELVPHVRKLADESTRGARVERWQLEKLIAKGYGLATAYYGDVEPDYNGGFKNGVRSLFSTTEGGPGEWRAIGAWAWGLSRILDFLHSEGGVDSKRVIVFGHSRLGKAALWAGAQDRRFAAVIANESGEGGAALSKRNFGEDVWHLNNRFPHWYSGNYKRYDNREVDLPLDHHMLLALIAPRPLYVASAAEDLHADPRGEFLSAVHAGRVYELFGRKGLGTDQMPRNDQPILSTVSYHVRTGKHDVVAFDWEQYLKFADTYVNAAK